MVSALSSKLLVAAALLLLLGSPNRVTSTSKHHHDKVKHDSPCDDDGDGHEDADKWDGMTYKPHHEVFEDGNKIVIHFPDPNWRCGFIHHHHASHFWPCEKGHYCSQAGWCGNSEAHRTDAKRTPGEESYIRFISPGNEDSIEIDTVFQVRWHPKHASYHESTSVDFYLNNAKIGCGMFSQGYADCMISNYTGDFCWASIEARIGDKYVGASDKFMVVQVIENDHIVDENPKYCPECDASKSIWDNMHHVNDCSRWVSLLNESRHNHSTLGDFMKDSDFSGTVFCVDNGALDAYQHQLEGDGRVMLKRDGVGKGHFIDDIFEYHAIPHHAYSSAMMKNHMLSPETRMRRANDGRHRVRISHHDDGSNAEIYLGSTVHPVRIVFHDIVCSNGILHVVSDIISPPKPLLTMLQSYEGEEHEQKHARAFAQALMEHPEAIDMYSQAHELTVFIPLRDMVFDLKSLLGLTSNKAFYDDEHWSGISSIHSLAGDEFDFFSKDDAIMWFGRRGKIHRPFSALCEKGNIYFVDLEDDAAVVDDQSEDSSEGETHKGGGGGGGGKGIEMPENFDHVEKDIERNNKAVKGDKDKDTPFDNNTEENNSSPEDDEVNPDSASASVRGRFFESVAVAAISILAEALSLF